MNLAEIRLQILDNLGTSIKVSHNHLARLINRAVEHLVNVVEQTGQIWNAADLGKSISVVSGTLEYQIVASDIRKILQVERTDLSGGNVRCIIIPWRDKNR